MRNIRVAIVIGQAAKALGKAHKNGIVHRDLKPDKFSSRSPTARRPKGAFDRLLSALRDEDKDVSKKE